MFVLLSMPEPPLGKEATRNGNTIQDTLTVDTCGTSVGDLTYPSHQVAISYRCTARSRDMTVVLLQLSLLHSLS
jgi:hypothetical protein